MNRYQRSLRSVNTWRSRQFVTFFLGALLACFTLIGTLAALAQSAPMLVSVTPADGATSVATNGTVVFVFDQDMDPLKGPFPSFPPVLIGNFEFQPPKLNLFGSWGADKRTLTIKCPGGLPYDTIISWTLNPPAQTAGLPQLSSASGQVLATVSGSFRTAVYIPPPPIPNLVSVTPTNGGPDVSPSSPVTFVFDQEMDTSTPLVASTPFVIGNYQFASFAPVPEFTGSWSPDKRTLTFQPGAPIALNSTVSWRLNPAGTTVPFKSTMDKPLAFTTGSYTIISNTGGGANEVCPPDTTVGYYTLTKTVEHRQTSASNVIPSPEFPPSFDVLAQSPPLANGGGGGGGGGKLAQITTQQVMVFGKITNASITLPNGTTFPLTNQTVTITPRRGGVLNTGNLIIRDSQPTEAALDSVYPLGNYTMRIGQEGAPEHVIPMNMPATPASLPMISNYDEAQAIDAAQNFTLRWDAFSPHGPGAFINLIITDQFGKLIFQSPNTCVPRTLDPTATSMVIPANYFKAGLNYHGLLQFGFNFYSSSNDAFQMIGNGTVQRTTSFTLKTTGSTGGTGTSLPVRFTAHHVLANGHPELSLSGTVGKSYTIRRTGSLTNPNWTAVGTVTINASGTAIFEDSDGALKFPAFYQAFSNTAR